MRPINKKAERTFRKLIAGLEEVGDATKIANSPAFMAVHVNRIGPNCYSVAHYFEQNGDLVADPDMEFFEHGGRIFPRTYQLGSLGVYRECTFGEYTDDGRFTPTRWYPREQRDQAIFAGQWMDNIKAQQGL